MIQIETPYGPMTIQLHINYRSSTGQKFFPYIHQIEKDIESIKKCNQVRFWMSKEGEPPRSEQRSFTVNNKTYTDLEGTLSLIKGEKYTYYTAKSGFERNTLTESATNKIRQQMDQVLVDAVEEFKDQLIAKELEYCITRQQRDAEERIKEAQEFLKQLKEIKV